MSIEAQGEQAVRQAIEHYQGGRKQIRCPACPVEAAQPLGLA